MRHISDRLSDELRQQLLGDSILTGRYGSDLHLWPEDAVREAVCLQLDLPWLEVSPEMVDPGLFAKQAGLCREHGFLPAFQGRISIHVFMSDPFDGPTIRELRNLFQREIHPIGTPALALERALSWLESGLVKQAQARPRPPSAAGELLSWHYRPNEGITFIERVLREAYHRQTSDVFFETYPDRLNIRFKIGGKCVVMPPIDTDYRAKVLSDAKAFGSMSTRESRGYRDGSTEMVMPDGNVLNIRVVAQKSLSGETMTLRLLDKKVVENLARSLPFPEAESAVMRELLGRSQGMIIVCGPTGSGKTTTLWRCLLSMNASEKKIVTIEDPVEYRFDRFVQLPVKGRESTGNEEFAETFPAAVRSCLRAAPDVILVGEIRDEETASAAVEAALTGHLILTTLHTPDALGVIPRLLDKDVSPFNLRQVLLAVVAQRLAPRLCPDCRVPMDAGPAQAAHYQFHGLKVPPQLYRRGGCPRCGSTGVIGRVPVFELFVPDDEMRAEITQDMKENVLRRKWVDRGGRSLGRHALELAAQGVIAYEEAASLETIYVPGAVVRADAP
ncbi:MAG: ATPase, T2SS/T4P/T4SS family [Opitutaceae bacterium]|nr:ATPase, T2SS/T4P/T4SS family [Opitutaceae bacterium]